MKLKDKVVIVTGGAIGIGEAIVRAFAGNGARIVIDYNRSQEAAENLVKELTANGVAAIAFRADVGKEDDIDKLFNQTIKEFKTVDILVNNASYSTGEDFLQGTRKMWIDQFTNNFLSVVSCSQKFIRLNQDRENKKIINISSVYGFGSVGSSKMLQYCAAKAAVNNFTQNLAKFSAPILVNAIAPGYVWTPQWYDSSQGKKQSAVKNLTIKRFVKPEEIAEGAIFLAKNDAVNGIILTIDGGQTLISKE